MKRFFSYFSVFILIGFILTACGGGGSDSSAPNPAPGLENHIPTALSQNVTTSMGLEIDITLAGSDTDGDSLIFTIESSPSNGTLFGTEQNITYIPNNNYTGTDSFTFTVNDGKATSTSATISININAVDPDNTAPNAIVQFVTTLMNQAANITLTGTDSDGESLTFAIASSPSHGTLSGTPPAVTYTPDSDYTGTDLFTFTVSDGKATSTAATVSISIPSSDGNVESTDLGFATLTAIDVTLPGSKVNAKEVYQMPHYIGRTNGESSEDDIDIPIRSYTATCNTDTETPSMFVSVTVSDGNSVTDATYGSVYELKYNTDTLSFEQTGNSTILTQCYESHGITASADCSRVAVLCNTDYKANETYPVDADIIEQHGSGWMKMEDNTEFQDDAADYKYNDQIWLMEWDNKKVTEKP